MAINIVLKNSSISGQIPATYTLELGELAINTYDGKLYLKKDVNGTQTVVEVAGDALRSIAVSSANGFAGSSTGGTNPTITLSTTISGILKGEGGALVAATPGTDYLTSTAGTASWALNVVNGSNLSASYANYADSANFALNSNLATYAIDAGYAISSSVAISSSYAIRANSALTATTASYALSTNTPASSSYALNATSASFATNAVNAVIATRASTAGTATSSLFATTATTATSASYASSTDTTISASFATNAVNANISISSSFATNAVNAVNATRATTAGVATSSLFANSSATATSASFASSTPTATSASFASSTPTATTAISASFASSTSTAISASFATRANLSNLALTANNALTADVATAANTASFVNTASFANNSTSASYALTSSYTLNAVSASYVLLATSASHALTSENATIATRANTAGTATSSLFADLATTAISTSYTANSETATSASFATRAALSDTASYVISVENASFAVSASYAERTPRSTTASYAFNAENTISSLSAISSSFATRAANTSNADFASLAGYTDNALSASIAVTAIYAREAIFANSSTSASYAETASYVEGGGGTGTPGGINTQIQYNSNGTFEGVPVLTYDGVTLSGTGSFAGSFSGSLTGTSSYATTASYALNVPPTVSWAINALTASSADNFIIRADVFQFSGSVSVSGSITGSLNGTSSWAVSASWAPAAQQSATASYVTSSNVEGPFGKNSILSASYALTASSADNFIIRADVFEFSGSLSVSGSITGSLNGTSSWAVSASRATTASYALNAAGSGFPFSGSAVITGSLLVSQSGITVTGSMNVTGSLTVNGTITAQTLVVQVVTSSTDFVTGSTRFGTLASNTHVFTGSVSISSSLTVNGPTTVSGSFTGSLSGSLIGTSSWATSASAAVSSAFAFTSISSSLSQTASYVTSSNIRGPFGFNSILSASYASGSTSSSYSINATAALSASYASGSTSSSYSINATTALSASYASSSTSASYSLNAGNTQTASFATNAVNALTASYVTSSNVRGPFGFNSILSASYASGSTSSSYALNAGNSISSSFATNAGSASYALNAGNAQTASFSTNAATAFIQGGNSFGVTALLGTNDSQSLSFETSGSVRMTISGSGAIGIGVSPTARFEIKSSAANNLGGLMLRATSTSNFPVLLYENSTNGGTLDLYNNATLVARVAANGDSYISSSGNFGVGTASPATKFQVNGTFASNALWTDTSANAFWGSYSTAYGVLTWDTAMARIYSTTGNTLRLGAAGANDHLIISSSIGNVGIGFTAPAAKLHVNGNVSASGLYINNSNGVYFSGDGNGTTTNGSGYFYFNQSGITYIQTLLIARTGISNDGAAHLTINGGTSGYTYINGSLGVGVTTPTFPINIASYKGLGIGGASTYTTLGQTNSGAMTILGHNVYTDTATANTVKVTNSGWYPSMIKMYYDHGITFHTTGALQTADTTFFNNSTILNERMRIDINGNVGIGTPSPLYKLDISGSARVSWSLSVGNVAPSITKGRIDAENDVVAYSTSDLRFKTNITPISNALDKITQIGGYEFDWIPNQEHHGFEGHDVGVIAQEIEKVLPEVIKERDSGYKAVKYEKIVPLLIEAVKEQQKQIDELKYLLQNKQ